MRLVRAFLFLAADICGDASRLARSTSALSSR
jgi:hypothetical protein